ncbi:MAG: hypothetical protein H0T42_15590 [Deltaproteobacteria bacterium]|nr:hypothetical protein [Deltaproteobacteria bacterium]
MAPKDKQSADERSTEATEATTQPSGSERARDEQREEGGPRYGGEAWQVADERGDNRFGKARNDDADPLELVKPGQEDEELEATASAPEENQVAATATNAESSGEAAGMGRGEKPRKPKSRAKK